MRALLILILAITATAARADLGSPSIQAVCKVTTADGKTYEGFIILIRGGYEGMQPNGFYVHSADGSKVPFLFDIEFYKLTRTSKGEYKIERKGEYNSSESQFSANKVSLLSITHDSLSGINQTQQEMREKNKNYLTMKTVFQKKYQVLDTLPLFTELPKYLNLGYSDNKLKRHNIPMKNIVSLEILWQPGKAMLDEIERKTKICMEEVNAPESTGDFLGPVWIHELIKDPEELKALKESYDKNYWR